jgi:hypothetical protein
MTVVNTVSASVAKLTEHRESEHRDQPCHLSPWREDRELQPLLKEGECKLFQTKKLKSNVITRNMEAAFFGGVSTMMCGHDSSMQVKI